MGFEPHDLRVMSPTSCQTAPSRDIMVPEAGVEPVRDKISRDFKSRASAYSAIPACYDQLVFHIASILYHLLNKKSILFEKILLVILTTSKKYDIIASRFAHVRSDRADRVCQNQRFCRANIFITQVVLRTRLERLCLSSSRNGLCFCDYDIIYRH